MKFWQKSFLILGIIFVFFLNVAIFIIARDAYKKQLNSYEDKATGEAYFIANAIYNDFSVLNKRGELSTSNEEKIFRSYAEFYQQQGIRIAIKKGEAWIYNNGSDVFADENLPSIDSDTIRLWTRTYDKEKYVTVQTKLREPYSDYTLLYRYHLVDFNKNWKRTTFIFIIESLMITFILSVILYFVLRSLTKPIYQLNNATKEIAEGNYKKRVAIKGNDELAELGRYFNQMSDKVEQTIENLKEETDRKQRLVDNLAHELRTPLTAISGYAEYLQMAKLEEEEKYNALMYIRKECKRLENLSQVLLLLADIRETKIPMERVSIEKIIKSIKYRLRTSIAEKEIDFNYENISIVVNGNYELLEIMISNIVENAIRASFENGKIEISSYQQGNKGILTIADNGIGMEKDELLHIMEPFYRVDKARSRKYGGVGLGTTLCDQIAKRHAATITYDSNVGLGTTVRIIFANVI